MTGAWFLVILACFVFDSCQGARILAVVPTPNYSHQFFFQPIWKELSLRGHRVTLLTTDPVKDPTLTNLTEIDLSFTHKQWKESIMTIANQKIRIISTAMMVSMFNKIIEQQLDHPEVQNLLHNETEHFDLVMVEYQMVSLMGFAHRFKCPYIALISYPPNSNILEYIGIPVHPILYSDLYGGNPVDLTFFQRLISFSHFVLMRIFAEYLYLSNERKTLTKYFGDDAPPLENIMRGMDLVLINRDQIIHNVRPIVPSVIEIGGGIHRKGPKPLPKELKKLLDDATNGFVYFSLGTNVQSQSLTNDVLDKILETFSELPYTFLWKTDLTNVANKSSNVHLAKWYPQQDIFKHPNIKLFIMQGGIQSLEEAIYEHVPLIGIPFFGDQPANVQNIINKGLGFGINFAKFTKDEFKSKILEVIQNPKYKENVKKLAELGSDQPMTGMEKAIWWVEYLLRNKNAKHLRSPLLDIPNYQYYLLDVIGFIFIVGFICVYVAVKISKILLRAVIYTLGQKKKIE